MRQLKKMSEELSSRGSQEVAWVLALRFTALGAAMGCSILVARLLQPVGRGIVASALVFPTTVAAFINLGLPAANVYFLSRTGRRGTLLANGLAFVAAVTVLSIPLFVIFQPTLRSSYYRDIASPWLIYAALACAPLLLLHRMLDQFLQGLQHYRIATLSTLVVELARIAFLLIALALGHMTVGGVIVATVAAYVCLDSYMTFFVARAVRGDPLRLDLPQFWRTLRFGVKEYLGSLLSFLNAQIDLFVLAMFFDPSSLGVYAVAVGMGELFSYLPAAATFVAFPKMAAHDEPAARRRIVRTCIKYDLLLLIAAWLVFAGVGKWVIPLVYGAGYLASYTLGLFLACGYVVLSVVTIVDRFFSASGRPEIQSLTRVLNLPVKAVVLYFLCRRYGIHGAAVAFAVSSMALLTTTLWFYDRLGKEMGKDDIARKGLCR
ncbi:MAG: oligosaccharide flippase family protein [Kiritimatiellae bacterium]|nr:oligosaccharide flippase family protein [Kiritimatiellia bacterium]